MLSRRRLFLGIQVAAAEESLKADTNADVVRDVRMRLQPLRRRARLVYFPAYIVQYTFGEVLAETGERRPQHFMAVISGMGVHSRHRLFTLPETGQLSASWWRPHHWHGASFCWVKGSVCRWQIEKT